MAAKWRCPQDWNDWVEWLSAGLHGRSRWRLSLVMVGMLFAMGRRTVSTWLRAAGVSIDFVDYYYFIGSLGRKTEPLATRLFERLLQRFLSCIPGDRVYLAIDDTPTKRYGPKVQGAGIHHNPTPGPTGQAFLYGHVWVTISWVVRHALWETIGLPLWALLYVRQKDVDKIPSAAQWQFRTKLTLAERQVRWAAALLRPTGKKPWFLVDGFYAKRPFLKAVRAVDGVVISRLRKDASLRDVPPPSRGGRGRPRKYGKNRISLAKRAGQPRGWQTITLKQYGQEVVKTYKTFLATYRSADGVIRVVIVKKEHGWIAFFCTDPQATVKDILEGAADRNAVEQDFHDVKEVWGAGQQQVRNLHANIATFNLNLWMYTLVEAWAWDKPKAELCDRSASPWDDPDRRPSHADRRKALRRSCIQEEFTTIRDRQTLPRKLLTLFKHLKSLVA